MTTKEHLMDRRELLKQVDQRIAELVSQKRQLERQVREEFKQEAQQHVGRCFRIDGKRYVKVLSVPQERHLPTGVDFNEYQFPAVYITPDDEMEPVEFDTLWSTAWTGYNNYFNTAYEEVSPQEFADAFEARIQKLRQQIGV